MDDCNDDKLVVYCSIFSNAYINLNTELLENIGIRNQLPVI